MHIRRLTMAIIGVWIGLSLAMLFVATQNFRGVDRLLEAPGAPASQVMETITRDDARALLRYQVSELNRFFFDWFGLVQVALAVALTVNLLFATNGHRPTLVICVLLVILVAIEKWYMTPEITYLGRLIDFVRSDLPSPVRSRFWSFHIAFSVMEVVKLLVLAALGIRVIMRSDRRRRKLSDDEELEFEPTRTR
jgi:hypothetical protein